MLLHYMPPKIFLLAKLVASSTQSANIAPVINMKNIVLQVEKLVSIFKALYWYLQYSLNNLSLEDLGKLKIQTANNK